MLKYVELKSGYSDCGPAWIARVNSSKSGNTIYFNGMALKKMKGGGISGNYCDLESGDEYWISGIKKQGCNRHWAGNGKIEIEESVVVEYLSIIGAAKLDLKAFNICADLPHTNGSQFFDVENEKL